MIKRNEPTKIRVRVTIELESGSVHTMIVKGEDDQISETLAMVDECWQSVGKKDGYVQFNHNFFQVSKVARYSYKVLPWWRFW